eukprot:4626583-Karenia_brevis.AAC.1
MLRTLPPSQARSYAQGHDEGMWHTVKELLGQLTGTVEAQNMAHALATLPMRMGGLGLRSAERVSQAAYWASWADAFPMVAA